MGDSFEDYESKPLTYLSKKQLRQLQKFGLPAAQTVQDISEEIAPRESALQLKLLDEFGKKQSQIGSEIAGQEAKASVSNDLNTILNGGIDLTKQVDEIDRLINPEFYSGRAATGAGFNALIEGQDPNKLSGAELANVERGINRLNARTGNLNTGDATTTAANAMTFGDELGKKRDRFASALSLFPGLSSSFRSPIDAQATATGKYAPTPNFGQQQYTGQTGTGAVQGFLDRTAATQDTQQQIKAGARNIADYSQGAVGSVCCFIMIAANEGKELPWYVRFCRDYYYSKQPEVAKGYKKMAKWLVPLMQKHSLIRKFIKVTMYNPITAYGGYLMGENKYGKMFKPVKNFWFKIWRTL